MATLEIRHLKEFGNKVQSDAARSVDLLHGNEDPLDALDVECEEMRQANLAADHFIEILKCADSAVVGSDVDLLSLFEGARDAVATAYEGLSVKHLCAINASEPSGKDGVVEAYALLLAEVASLHDKLNSLCWIIGEQQADEDRTLPGAFSNADDLFAAMGV